MALPSYNNVQFICCCTYRLHYLKLNSDLSDIWRACGALMFILEPWGGGGGGRKAAWASFTD
jgi:hypothetical protein